MLRKWQRLFTKGKIVVATVLIHNSDSLLHGTFFTQWLCYKSINLHLNIIGLHYIHLSFLMRIKTSNQTIYIYSWKQKQYLQAILCEMFLWIRKGKVLPIEFLCFQTIVLFVLYKGMIILIIVISKGCLKLVSTTAQKFSLTLCVLQCHFWCNFPILQMSIKTEIQSGKSNFFSNITLIFKDNNIIQITLILKEK